MGVSSAKRGHLFYRYPIGFEIGCWGARHWAENLPVSGNGLRPPFLFLAPCWGARHWAENLPVSGNGLRPPFLFLAPQKEKRAAAGPKRKNALPRSGAVALRADGGLPSRCRQRLPARAGLLIYTAPAPRVRCVSRRGGKSHGPCFCPRCRSMVPRRARQRLAERKARRSENVKCDLAPTASVSTQPRGLANKPEQTPPRPWGGHHKLEGTLSRPAPV